MNIEVILDLKDGGSVHLKAAVDGVTAEKLRNGAVDHVSVRVERPPNAPPMQEVFSVWKPRS